MHLHSHLRSAEEIIKLYDGVVPFAGWLKNYFRQHKKFGSKDRKTISDLCFCYFRLGGISIHSSKEEALLIGQFLCHNDSLFIRELRPQWYLQHASPVMEKLALLGLDVSTLSPLSSELSKQIDPEAFMASHFVQPDLFLRMRPGNRKGVMGKLQDAGISFSTENDCLRLANNTKIEELLKIDEEVVIQDKSSQQVLDALQHQTPNSKHQTFTAWDCCAASGGKTILLHDLFPKAQLTVSDIRESILHNLRNRFKRAGIQQYQSFVADVSANGFHLSKQYDVIICDAPCSGSGTWGRTPEQLTFFQKDKIEYYANLQKRIALNASNSLKEAGRLIYITCSVFQKENEDVVDYLLQSTPLNLVDQRYFKGYTKKADTLFAALFQL